MGPNLGRHLLFCSQIPPHNAVREEFGTSLSMNFGKANSMLDYVYTRAKVSGFATNPVYRLPGFVHFHNLRNPGFSRTFLRFFQVFLRGI